MRVFECAKLEKPRHSSMSTTRGFRSGRTLGNARRIIDRIICNVIEQLNLPFYQSLINDATPLPPESNSSHTYLNIRYSIYTLIRDNLTTREEHCTRYSCSRCCCCCCSSKDACNCCSNCCWCGVRLLGTDTSNRTSMLPVWAALPSGVAVRPDGSWVRCCACAAPRFCSNEIPPNVYDEDDDEKNDGMASRYRSTPQLPALLARPPGSDDWRDTERCGCEGSTTCSGGQRGNPRPLTQMTSAG